MVTHAGDKGLLQAYLTQGTFWLRLYANDLTPQKADAIAAYQEPFGSGYGPIALNTGLWNVSGPPPLAVYPQMTFAFTGALGLMYGYFIEAPDGTLFGAERFSNGPYNIQRNGDVIKVTPTVIRET